MLIDWFTVSAQVLNFLILIWLLKRYLYRPVLAAIETREAKIAATLASADESKSKAERERTELAAERELLEQQRHAILTAAEGEAKEEATRLLASAEADRVERRKALHHELQLEASSFQEEIIRRIRGEIVSCVRQILKDLASASLEQSSLEFFLRRLDEVPATKALNGHRQAKLRCPFLLPAELRQRFDDKVRERFGPGEPTQIEVDSSLLLGFELTVGDRRVEWTVDSYLASFKERLDEKAKTRTVT